MAENGRVADEGKKSHCFWGNQLLLCQNHVFKSILVLNGFLQNKQCRKRYTKQFKEGLVLDFFFLKKKAFTLSSKNIERRILQHSSQ
jgi:hypothetical protein